jgi:hypothetical protein
MTGLRTAPADAGEGLSAADRAGRLHEEKKRIEAELERLKPELAAQATFKGGSRTGHLSGSRYKVTVQLRENVSWSQDGLELARAAMGDEEFFRTFRWRFEPRSKKDLDEALKTSPHADIIRRACTTKEGSPYLTFTLLGDG